MMKYWSLCILTLSVIIGDYTTSSASSAIFDQDNIATELWRVAEPVDSISSTSSSRFLHSSSSVSSSLTAVYEHPALASLEPSTNSAPLSDDIQTSTPPFTTDLLQRPTLSLFSEETRLLRTFQNAEVSSFPILPSRALDSQSDINDNHYKSRIHLSVERKVSSLDQSSIELSGGGHGSYLNSFPSVTPTSRAVMSSHVLDDFSPFSAKTPDILLTSVDHEITPFTANDRLYENSDILFSSSDIIEQFPPESRVMEFKTVSQSHLVTVATSSIPNNSSFIEVRPSSISITQDDVSVPILVWTSTTDSDNASLFDLTSTGSVSPKIDQYNTPFITGQTFPMSQVNLEASTSAAHVKSDVQRQDSTRIFSDATNGAINFPDSTHSVVGDPSHDTPTASVVQSIETPISEPSSQLVRDVSTSLKTDHPPQILESQMESSYLDELAHSGGGTVIKSSPRQTMLSSIADSQYSSQRTTVLSTVRPDSPSLSANMDNHTWSPVGMHTSSPSVNPGLSDPGLPMTTVTEPDMLEPTFQLSFPQFTTTETIVTTGLLPLSTSDLPINSSQDMGPVTNESSALITGSLATVSPEVLVPSYEQAGSNMSEHEFITSSSMPDPIAASLSAPPILTFSDSMPDYVPLTSLPLPHPSLENSLWTTKPITSSSSHYAQLTSISPLTNMSLNPSSSFSPTQTVHSSSFSWDISKFWEFLGMTTMYSSSTEPSESGLISVSEQSNDHFVPVITRTGWDFVYPSTREVSELLYPTTWEEYPQMTGSMADSGESIYSEYSPPPAMTDGESSLPKLNSSFSDVTATTLASLANGESSLPKLNSSFSDVTATTLASLANDESVSSSLSESAFYNLSRSSANYPTLETYSDTFSSAVTTDFLQSGIYHSNETSNIVFSTDRVSLREASSVIFTLPFESSTAEMDMTTGHLAAENSTFWLRTQQSMPITKTDGILESTNIVPTPVNNMSESSMIESSQSGIDHVFSSLIENETSVLPSKESVYYTTAAFYQDTSEAFESMSVYPPSLSVPGIIISPSITSETDFNSEILPTVMTSEIWMINSSSPLTNFTSETTSGLWMVNSTSPVINFTSEMTSGLWMVNSSAESISFESEIFPSLPTFMSSELVMINSSHTTTSVLKILSTVLVFNNTSDEPVEVSSSLAADSTDNVFLLSTSFFEEVKNTLIETIPWLDLESTPFFPTATVSSDEFVSSMKTTEIYYSLPINLTNTTESDAKMTMSSSTSLPIMSSPITWLVNSSDQFQPTSASILPTRVDPSTRPTVTVDNATESTLTVENTTLTAPTVVPTTWSTWALEPTTWTTQAVGSTIWSTSVEEPTIGITSSLEPTTQSRWSFENNTEVMHTVEPITQLSSLVENSTEASLTVVPTTWSTMFEITTQLTGSIEPSSQASAIVENTTEATPTVGPTTWSTFIEEPTTQLTWSVEPTSHDTATMELTSVLENTTEAIPTVEPTAQPTSTQEPTTHPMLTTEPTVQPTSTLVPTSHPLLTVEPTTQLTSMVENITEATPTVEPTQTVEPTSEPTSTVDNITQPISTVEPTTNPTSIVENTTEATPTVEPTQTVEPTSEPTTTVDNITQPISTVEPTTQPTTPMTTPAVTTPSLNASQASKIYWVVTVIKVKKSEDVTTKEFSDKMEQRLVQAYVDAFRRAEEIENGTYEPLKRRRRYAQAEDLQLEMIEVTRSDTSNDVDLAYYMEKGGQPVPADTAISQLKLFSQQELALKLGYVVENNAREYDPVPVAVDDPPQYWIIGAVLGPVAGAAVIVWCILCIYYRCNCCRAPIDKEPDEEPHLVALKDKDFEASHPEATYMEEVVQKTTANGTALNRAPKKQTYTINEEEDPLYAEVRKLKKRSSSRKAEKRRKAREEVEGSELEDTTENVSDAEEDVFRQAPVKPTSRKPRSRRQPRAHQRSLDSADDVTEEVSEDSGVRTSVHHMRVPQVPIPARGTQNGQIPNSKQSDSDLQHKADLERWKNKQRLREKRRNSRGEPERPQRRKPRLDKGEITRSRAHITAAEPREPAVRVEGFVNEAYSESEPEADRHNPESLEQARERMHQLLDDAFSLVGPAVHSNQKNKISPRLEPSIPSDSLNSTLETSSRPKPMGRSRPQPARRRESTDVEIQELKKQMMGDNTATPPKPTPRKSTEKKHTPIIIDRGKRLKEVGNNSTSWNPYRVGDSASLLALPQEEIIQPKKAQSSPVLGRFHTTSLKEKTPNSHGAMLGTSETYLPKSTLTTTEPEPIVITTRKNAWDYGSDHDTLSKYDFHPKDTSTLNNSSTKYSGTNNSSKYAALIRELDSDSLELKHSPRSRTALDYGDIEMEHMGNGVSRNGRKPGTRMPEGSDEIDVIKGSLGPGVTPEPLIRSIREELIRLSSRSGNKDFSSC